MPNTQFNLNCGFHGSESSTAPRTKHHRNARKHQELAQCAAKAPPFREVPVRRRRTDASARQQAAPASRQQRMAA